MKDRNTFDMFAPKSFPDLAKLIATCSKCKLPKPCVGWDDLGSYAAAIMFIGEALGEQEVKLKRPFVGRAGKQFDRDLKFVGLLRPEVYTGNVVKSRPTLGDKNRKPHEREIRACLPYTQAEIQLLKPKVVVLLGGTASGALLGSDKISDIRGKIQTMGGVTYLPTYHPSYVMRSLNFDSGKRIRTEFVMDLILAKKLSQTEFAGPLVGNKIIDPWNTAGTLKYIGMTSESAAKEMLMETSWKISTKKIDGYMFGNRIVKNRDGQLTIYLLINAKASMYSIVRSDAGTNGIIGHPSLENFSLLELI